jgi:AraC-like DNA-binding protein
MLMLAAIPAERLLRLRSADPERFVFEAAPTWAQAVRVIRRRPVGLAVVDPLLEGEPRVHEIERLRSFFPSLPLVAYTTLSPETASVLLALGRIGVRRAVFARIDDDPAFLRTVLRDEWALTAPHQVLQGMEPFLARLPERVRWALEGAMQAPGETGVEDLAQRAQLGRRTCERLFAKLGLPSPSKVLQVARLLYAHRLLLDPGFTVEDVARKLGYARSRSLQLQLRAAFGRTAGEARMSLGPDEALALLSRRLLGDHEQLVG